MTCILVEGKEDKIFISYLLDNLLDKKELYRININNGNGINEGIAENIRSNLELDCNKFIIINDADNNFGKRQKELEDKMQKEHITGNIFLFPNNKDNGILENLLLECMPNEHKIPQCFDKFIKCLEGLAKEYSIILPPIKTKVYSYVDVQKDKKYNKKYDGSYYYNSNLWNFKNEYIKPLLEFLDKNVR